MKRGFSKTSEDPEVGCVCMRACTVRVCVRACVCV